MIDLNGPPPRAHIDSDALHRALIATADRWAPRLFPRARAGNGELRMANIEGAPPRKSGSCVITLAGDDAGSWFDHGTNEGGGPIDTVRQATGLSGHELYERAAELAGFNGHAPPQRAPRVKGDSSGEIEFIKRRCVPVAGTLAETYLASRELVDPRCADLLFCDDVNDWAARRGRPAMIGIVRSTDGKLTGSVHRTYLRDDGTGKAEGMPKGPKMLLGTGAGVIMLMPMGPDGVLGIAEGIETALAASQLHGVPVWSTISSGGMIAFQPPPGCRRLVIFRDAGHLDDRGINTSLAAAQKAAETASVAGIEWEIRVPRGGDDFADDLAKGLLPLAAEPEIVQAGTLADVSAQIAALRSDSPPAELDAVARAVAALRLNKDSLAATVDKISRNMRLSRATVSRLVKAESTELRSNAGAFLIDNDGNPVRCVYNAMVTLRSSDEWSDILRWNLFDLCVSVVGRLPWEIDEPAGERRWEDVFDVRTAAWLQQQGIYIGTTVACEAATAIAHENPWHPVAAYLDALEWDGVPRLEDWLTRVFGCDDDAYHRAVGAKMLVAAVRRVRHPGCKFDCMMILKGPQGILKSTVLEVLAGPEWFTDQMPKDIGGAEASKALAGKWLIEFSEIDQIIRTEVETVRAFLSRKVDHYRKSYGRHSIDQPRQCIFFGTTNSEQFLKDDAGNRRFWPVECRSEGGADIEWLRENRDQLWAEAAQAEASGYPVWLDDPAVQEMAGEAQADRMIEDSWEIPIRRHVALMTSVTTSEVMSTVLSIPLADHTKATQMRVGSVLRGLGWKTVVRRDRDGVNRVWIRQ